MAYPFATLPTNKRNDSDTGDETQPTVEGPHAKNENDHARALNDLLALLGGDPAGSWTSVQERFDQELLGLRSTRSVGLIVHGASATTPRPTTHFAYIWRGTVVPNNLVAGRDIYMPTSSDTVGSGGGGGAAGQEVASSPTGNVSGTVACNMSGRVNTVFNLTPTAPTTVTLSNFTTLGQYAEIRIVQPATPQTVNLPSCQVLVGPISVPMVGGSISRFGFQYMGGLSVDGWNLGDSSNP